MCAKKIIITACIAIPNLAIAQNGHSVDVSSYAGFFSTSMPNRPGVQVLSPLGAQIGYSYHLMHSSSVFTQYNALSTGQSIVLQGINLGFEYSFIGGHDSFVTSEKDTTISTTCEKRISAFSSLAFRLHNLKDILGASKNLLGPTVPVEGKILGLDVGVGLEQPFLSSIKFSSRASVLVPKFIGQDNQTGTVISFSAGLSSSL